MLLAADVQNPHWTTIGGAEPELHRHNALKVPHHGSSGALHATFLRSAPGRLWLVTPYSRSRLPRFADGDGAAVLLAHEHSLYLTGLPEAHDRQMDAPCQATRQELRDGARPRPVPFDFLPGLPGTTIPIRNDVCHYVIAVFDEEGHCESVFTGPGTIHLTEARIAAPVAVE